MKSEAEMVERAEDSGTPRRRWGVGRRGASLTPQERAVVVATLIMLALLCLQLVAGMLTNLYIHVPQSHPGADSAHYFVGLVRAVIWVVGARHLGVLVVHSVLGLSLAAGSLVVILFAVRTARRSWIVTAVLGWFGVFAAGFNGVSFLNYGHDFSSLIMSLAFLIALVSYGVGAYLG